MPLRLAKLEGSMAVGRILPVSQLNFFLFSCLVAVADTQFSHFFWWGAIETRDCLCLQSHWNVLFDVQCLAVHFEGCSLRQAARSLGLAQLTCLTSVITVGVKFFRTKFVGLKMKCFGPLFRKAFFCGGRVQVREEGGGSLWKVKLERRQLIYDWSELLRTWQREV